MRGDLTDDEANHLLAWAEAQTMEIAGRDLSDEAFDAYCANLRRLLAQINTFIGKREGAAAQAQHPIISEIVAQAQTLGYGVAQAEMEAYLRQQTALPSLEALQNLTALIKTPSPSSDSGKRDVDDQEEEW
jgi:hypothetical protein